MSSTSPEVRDARESCPERQAFLVHSAERGHLWREAIRAYKAGERGVAAAEAIRSIADEFGWEPPTPEEDGVEPPSTKAPRSPEG